MFKRRNRFYPTSQHRMSNLSESRDRKEESLGSDSRKIFEQNPPSPSAFNPFSSNSLDEDSKRNSHEVRFKLTMIMIIHAGVFLSKRK